MPKFEEGEGHCASWCKAGGYCVRGKNWVFDRWNLIRRRCCGFLQRKSEISAAGYGDRHEIRHLRTNVRLCCGKHQSLKNTTASNWNPQLRC